MSHYPYRLLMDETKQLELIKEFMVALAPEVARHRFALIRHRQVVLPVTEEGEADHTDFALHSAKLTLELAMHLAAHYGGCYDTLQGEENDNPSGEPSPGAPAAHLRQAGEGLPL